MPLTMSLFFILLCFSVHRSLSQHLNPSHQAFSLPLSLLTSTQRYKHLTKFPLHHLLIPSRRSRLTSFLLPFSFAVLILGGDIQLNPGPTPTTSFSLCSYNICSLTSNSHTIYLHDLIQTHNPDLIALTETLVTPLTTPSELASSTPPGYTLASFPRTTKKIGSDKILGGGSAFLIKDPTPFTINLSTTFKSFEYSSITLKLCSSSLTVFNIYHPPNTSKYTTAFGTFLDEFQTFLSSAATTPHEFIITGDLNVWVDAHQNPDSIKFHNLLSSSNLKQHVSFPTHKLGHTLDLVITSEDTKLLPQITNSLITVSDHFPLFTHLNITPIPLPPPSNHSFRRIHSIDIDKFKDDLASSDLIINTPQ